MTLIWHQSACVEWKKILVNQITRLKTFSLLQHCICIEVQCCYYPPCAQVHCLVEHGAVLERADNNGTRGPERTTGCQNPALVASLLKKGSKTGTNTMFIMQ